jgi:hypothetical protein
MIFIKATLSLGCHEEDQRCRQGYGSAHQVTFSEVSLPRSFAISRNCSNPASGSSTISWAMMSSIIYRKWCLGASKVLAQQWAAVRVLARYSKLYGLLTIERGGTAPRFSLNIWK